MTGEVNVTVVGNATEDPVLRSTKNGTAVANFSVAVNHRKYNAESGEWEESDTIFYPVSVFGRLASNVAASVEKGHRVIVTGVLKEDRWEDEETGDSRSRTVVHADNVGVSLMFATAEVTKAEFDKKGSGKKKKAESNTKADKPKKKTKPVKKTEPQGDDFL